MHIVGARFANLESANAALAEIRACVAIPREDVAVRPLGSTRYEEPVADFLLAGRFPAGEVDRALGIVEHHGGAILGRRIELPHPSLAATGGTAGPDRVRDERGRAPERHRSPTRPSGTAPASQPGAHRRLPRPGAALRSRAALDRRFSA